MTLSPAILILLASLAGLLIGSFLNVCIFRLPRDMTVVNPPRSFCPECEAQIQARDNIPVLSYLLLGGKCRHCKAKIPWRYPVVELSTGIAFAVAVVLLGPTLAALKMCVFWAIMIDLIATDFEERILPDEFTLGGALVGLIFAWFVTMEVGPISMLLYNSFSAPWRSVGEAAFSAVLPSLLIWSVGWAYEKIRHREGMGLGDVKMIGTIGAFLGLASAMFTLALGGLLGAIFGITYAVLKKKDIASYELPYGSFLGIAALGLSVVQILHQ